METLRKTIHPETRIIDSAKGICDYVASDESIDSYREVIRASGWRFRQFQKNAPFVDSHDYSSIRKLCGKVIDFRLEGSQLIERVQWAIDVPDNELARIGWKMTEAGYLKAVSVGFRAMRYVSRWDSNPDMVEAWNQQCSELKIDPVNGPCVCIYLEQEQLELSACILGANPNALAKMAQAYKAGVLGDADIETLSRETSQRETANATDSPALVAWARERAREEFLVKFQQAIR
jgi:hypothetical protein